MQRLYASSVRDESVLFWKIKITSHYKKFEKSEVGRNFNDFFKKYSELVAGDRFYLDSRFHWNCGNNNNLDKFLFKTLRNQNMIFFATNNDGLVFENYVIAVKKDYYNI